MNKEDKILDAIEKIVKSNEALTHAAYANGYKEGEKHSNPSPTTITELNNIKLDIATMNQFMQNIDEKMKKSEERERERDKKQENMFQKMDAFILKANQVFEQKECNRKEHREIKDSIEEGKKDARKNFASIELEKTIKAINRNVWIAIIVAAIISLLTKLNIL